MNELTGSKNRFLRLVIGAGAAVLFLSSISIAQTPQIEWVRQLGTSAIDDFSGLAVDASGVYAVGFTDGAWPGQIPQGGRDVIVCKFGFDGALIWTRQFGTSALDQGQDIEVGPGGIYVVGYTQGTFPGQVLGRSDLFLAKFDSNGDQLWCRQYGAYGNIVAYALAADATGVYAAGDTGAILPGQTNKGWMDGAVVKFGPEGDVVFSSQFGTPDVDQIRDIAVSPEGIYVAGSYHLIVHYQPDEAMVLKLDRESGEPLWQTYLGTSGGDQLWGIAVNDNGLYVTGTTTGIFEGFPPPISTYSGFLSRLDPQTGDRLWLRQLGDVQQLDRVAVNANAVYSVGVVRGVIGLIDILVCKHSFDGSLVWKKVFGTTSDENAMRIALDGSSIFTSGYTIGVFPGQTPFGGPDALLMKLTDNLPPVAEAGPDPTLLACESASFSGAGSFDPDGSIVRYQWDFGDGTVIVGTPAGHVYQTPGIYTVTLSVTDDSGATGTDSAVATVKSVADGIQILIDLIGSFNLQQGIDNSLDVKLQRVRDAQVAAGADQRQDAQNHIQAFMAEVNAQRGKALSYAQADQLLSWASRIYAVIGNIGACRNP